MPVPLSSEMTLDVVFTVSVPWFPHLPNRVIVRVKQINICKAIKGIRVTQVIQKSHFQPFLLLIVSFPSVIETGVTDDASCLWTLRAFETCPFEGWGTKTPLTQQPTYAVRYLCRPFYFKVTLS